MTVLIAAGDLELRQFRRGDEADLFAVRNHESVRRFMADPRTLDYAAHVTWVRTNLLEGERILLFVARKRGQAVGVTLLKRVSQDSAEIGVMFREAARHGGAVVHAAVATLHYAFDHRRLARLTSYVLPDHARAVAINTALGGREVASDKPGMLQFSLGRDECLSNASYRRILARLAPRLRVSEE